MGKVMDVMGKIQNPRIEKKVHENDENGRK